MSASTTDRIDLRMPAVAESIPHIRHAIVSFARGHGYDALEAIGLAVTEAATNAVLHAYVGSDPGDVRAVACAEPERLVVVVRDWGSGMAPRLDTPGLGLGLPTIAALAASFDVEAADGRGTLMRMQFHRESAAATA